MAGVPEMRQKGQALLKKTIPSLPPMTLQDPWPDVSWGIVPAPGMLDGPGEFGATPSLAPLPSALGQVAWNESEG